MNATIHFALERHVDAGEYPGYTFVARSDGFDQHAFDSHPDRHVLSENDVALWSIVNDGAVVTLRVVRPHGHDFKSRKVFTSDFFAVPAEVAVGRDLAHLSRCAADGSLERDSRLRRGGIPVDGPPAARMFVVQSAAMIVAGDFASLADIAGKVADVLAAPQRCVIVQRQARRESGDDDVLTIEALRQVLGVSGGEVASHRATGPAKTFVVVPPETSVSGGNMSVYDPTIRVTRLTAYDAAVKRRMAPGRWIGVLWDREQPELNTVSSHVKQLAKELETHRYGEAGYAALAAVFDAWLEYQMAEMLDDRERAKVAVQSVIGGSALEDIGRVIALGRWVIERDSSVPISVRRSILQFSKAVAVSAVQNALAPEPAK